MVPDGLWGHCKAHPGSYFCGLGVATKTVHMSRQIAVAKIFNVDGHKELNGFVNCIGFAPNGVTAVPFVVVEVRREYAITMPAQHGGVECLHIEHPLNTPNLWTEIMHCALRRTTEHAGG